MERVIFVEVLDRRGEVQRRERVESFPLRIGRAYDNDLILEDPHVCPAHAVLDWLDGSLTLRDLASVNGLHTLPGRERVPSLEVGSGASVQIGRTLLRFRDPAHLTPPALRLRRRPRYLEWALTRPLAGCAWLTLLLGISLIDAVRSAHVEIDWASQASALAGAALISATWAGAWALVGRLLGQRPRFVTHFAIAVLALLFGMLQKAIFEVGQFLFTPVEPQRAADMAADGLVLGSVLYAHLSVLHVARPWRRRLVAAGLGSMLFGFQLSTLLAEPTDWIAVLPYWSRLEPIDPKWLSVVPSPAFFGEVKGLEPELLQLRAESLAEDP